MNTSALDKLQPQLAALEALGADRFDPVRFAFIRSMTRRAHEQPTAVTNIVAAKALAALADYEAALAVQRSNAETVAERVAGKHPAAADQVQQLLEEFEFRAIDQLESRLERTSTTSAVSALTLHLNHGQPTPGDVPQVESIVETLRQQENALLESLADKSRSSHRPESEPRAELKSVQHFREALVAHGADQRVNQIVSTAPTDSGPLNPQKLVIRSLATMRELSPRYVGRLVAYVDTLFWLEKADPDSRS